MDPLTDPFEILKETITDYPGTPQVNAPFPDRSQDYLWRGGNVKYRTKKSWRK
jgi:hypothetical protein